MKRLIELLKTDVNFRNGHKELFARPIISIVNSGTKFSPTTYNEAKSINKSLIGYSSTKKDFAITIYRDEKFYCVYIPNIECYGFLDYTIESEVYFEIFGYKWTIAELTKKQEDIIWSVIKDYKYENNIFEDL